MLIIRSKISYYFSILHNRPSIIYCIIQFIEVGLKSVVGCVRYLGRFTTVSMLLGKIRAKYIINICIIISTINIIYHNMHVIILL